MGKKGDESSIWDKAVKKDLTVNSPEDNKNQDLASEAEVDKFIQSIEHIVIVDQHATVNTFPGLVHTARHTMGVGLTRRRCANRKEAGDHGRVSDWGEVVTR